MGRRVCVTEAARAGVDDPSTPQQVQARPGADEGVSRKEKSSLIASSPIQNGKMERVAAQFVNTASPPHPADRCRIEHLLESHLLQICGELSAARQIEDVCLLADSGDILVYLSEVLARLGTILAFGDPSREYVEQRISHSAHADDISNLGVVDYLDDKHAALKDLATILTQTAETARFAWSQSVRSPRLQRLPSDSAGAATETPTGRENSVSAVSVNSEISHIVDSDHPTYSSLPMDSLKARGKGQHTCPHGTSCTKGGVLPGGQLAVFERNSAFRTHLQKHEKRYRCDIPGCANKTGFARIDQLERHKRDVRHG